MRYAIAVVLVAVLVGATVPEARDEYPQDYFRSPVGIPILLSGSFAELRSNHFHSGIDIKTNKKVGYRIYAAADGHISRIKVSPTGFGNALYVRHPNGYTTVYAHLLSFEDHIQEWVKSQQYRNKRFAVDLYPDAGVFPVTKGEVIALSGNSGSSGGPHLHFEIRDSGTEWPLNPQLFGFDIKDNVPPQIRKVKVYVMDDESVASIKLTNGRSRTVRAGSPVLLQTVGDGRSTYRLDGVSSIHSRGRIAFGLETRDTHNGSQSRLGPYRITLTADGEPVFGYLAEKFSFSNTRYLNAHADYQERQDNRRWIHRSFVFPGNKLPSYENVVNRGVVELDDTESVTMRYEVVDTPGNQTSLEFTLVGDDSLSLPEPKDPNGQLISHASAATIVHNGFRAEVPAGALYEDIHVEYSTEPDDASSFSTKHVFHDPATPIHKHVRLALDASDLPEDLRMKAALARENDEGKVSLQAADYDNGWITARVRSFGTYFVSADTVKPRVRAINIKDGSVLSRSGNIRFRISDRGTGIGSYEGLINGEWVLFEYDAKTGMLIHTFDGRVERGSHRIVMTVRDNVGNTTTFEAGFTR